MCDLFTLNCTLCFLAFLLSVFLFPFFHLSDEQQPELNKKIKENLCDSAANGGEGTYDVFYLPTRKRWEDEINEFIKTEETEESKGNDQKKNNDTWLQQAKQSKEWKAKEEEFAKTSSGKKR